MSEMDDKALLHGALDGELSADERARLEARLSADPSLSARSDRLRELTAVLDVVGGDEPPAGLADRVMAAVAESEAGRSAARPERASARDRVLDRLLEWIRVPPSRDVALAGGGGPIVARRALWAVAGLAVVAVLMFTYSGGRQVVDKGAEGTIAAANPAGPASADAKTTQTQAFLRSDAFSQVLGDENVRGLLSSPESLSALSRANTLAALGDETAASLVADADVQATLARADLRGALGRADVKAVVASAEGQAAMADPSVRRVLASPPFLAALKDPGLFEALRAHAAAKRGPTATSQRADVLSRELLAALEVESFARLVVSDRLREAVLANGPATAVVFASLDGPMARVLTNARLLAAMQDDGATEFFASPRLGAALRDARFVSVLGDPRLPAALRDPAAIQAALSAAR